MKDFRVTPQGISKGYVDAILKYTDLIVLEAYAELKALENDPSLNYIGIHWDNAAFRKVRDSMIENDEYNKCMLSL